MGQETDVKLTLLTHSQTGKGILMLLNAGESIGEPAHS